MKSEDGGLCRASWIESQSSPQNVSIRCLILLKLKMLLSLCCQKVLVFFFLQGRVFHGQNKNSHSLSPLLIPSFLELHRITPRFRGLWWFRHFRISPTRGVLPPSSFGLHIWCHVSPAGVAADPWAGAIICVLDTYNYVETYHVSSWVAVLHLQEWEFEVRTEERRRG